LNWLKVKLFQCCLLQIHKNPIFFDTHKIGPIANSLELDVLFSESKVDEVYTAISLQSDIESIKQISDNTYAVKTFDYDGIKYSKKDCKSLISKLEKDLELLNEKIKTNDIEIFKYFRSIEQNTNLNPTLEQLYNHFFNYDREFDAKYDVYVQLTNELQFINYTTPFDQIRINFIKIEALEERLKKGVSEILTSQDYQTEITKEIRENFELYLTKKWQYFANEKYLEKNLEIFLSAKNNYAFLLSRGYFLAKQKMIKYQEELIEATHNSMFKK